MEIHKRAISHEQKSERENLILQTARWALLKKDYETINMAEIAKQSGLAKGTLYLYFKNKETLFLLLTEVLFTEWLDELDLKIKSLTENYSIDLYNTHFLDILGRQTLLLKLLSVVHGCLEPNVDVFVASSFRKRITERIKISGMVMEGTFTSIPVGFGFLFLKYIYIYLIGLRQLSLMNLTEGQTLAFTETGPLDINFRNELQQIMLIIMSRMDLTN